MIESNTVTPTEIAPEVIVATPQQKEIVQEASESDTGRGRKAGERFEKRFTCPCGRAFKYEKAYKTHQESCPEGKKSMGGPRGRREGEILPAQFRCRCGRTFKYKKAFLNHKNICRG